jgi:hypothetical protein
MALSNFGEQFAAKTLRSFYQSAVTPAIANTNYEGEIKKAGDRVNILSFLNDIVLGDYVDHTDMDLETIVDNEDQLIVEKRKYYNFPIGKLADLFTYGEDISDNLTENAAKVLERTVDAYVLENAQYARAGNWVGINVRVAGGGATSGTQASIATTATGGTLTLQADDEGGNATTGGSDSHVIENSEDGGFYHSGFNQEDVGKPIRLTSGKTWATGWYRITTVTDSVTATIENWDSATSGSDIPNGDILRYLGGGAGDDEATYNRNEDGKPTTVVTNGANCGWGWEFQAAVATGITASNVYEAITKLGTALDKGEIPDTDRHITVPPIAMELLKNASELQPAISMAYEGVVLNGKVGRCAGFDIHMAAGARVSTRASHRTAASVMNGKDTTDALVYPGTTGYQILANHISFVTFAYKWSESRIKDAENQFTNKYQALHLYGAKVPDLRRKAGAVLFASF